MKKTNKIYNTPEFGTWYSVKDNILPPRMPMPDAYRKEKLHKC